MTPINSHHKRRRIESLPATLWSQRPADVGLIKGTNPVHIRPKGDHRSHHRQNLLKTDTVEGIKPTLQALLEAAVIRECNDSPVNTTLFLVKKTHRLSAGEWFKTYRQ